MNSALGAGLLVLHGLSTAVSPPQDRELLDSRDCERMVAEAVQAAGGEAWDHAERLLVRAVELCPAHREALRELAGLRFRQGRFGEAADLASTLLTLDPANPWAWDLLGSARYLSDDARGALDAWNRIGRPVVRSFRLEWTDRPGGEIARRVQSVVGIETGESLTPDALERASRQLDDLPAVSRSRLGYRPLPDGGAAVEGTIQTAPPHPFRRAEVPAHLLRGAGGTVRLDFADRVGALDRWTATALLGREMRRVDVEIAHLAPAAGATWAWRALHEVGRYRIAGTEGNPVRSERSGARWQAARHHARGTHLAFSVGADHWKATGLHAAGGVALTIRPPVLPVSVEWKGEGWQGSGTVRRFGRTSVHAAVEREPRTGLEWEARTGLDLVSSAAPPDLVPRFGAGRSATRLLRARTVSDPEGVIRLDRGGTAWLHGGVEVRRWAGPRLPLTPGVALFVDAAHQAGATEGGGGEVHLGAGLRARIPGVQGWLRGDWATDLSGRSLWSAAWVRRR